MILDSITTPVEVNGGGAKKSFSIAINGKAFKVLSSTLYSNKIGSIVREISCNAYDAHVMKGNPEVPFEIHLPDAFEPYFTVQDYGVGLSKDDVYNVFTVLFESTKDQSNDCVGAFGLGSKTPFSYTDQFTVSSVKDGVRTVYNAFITETGVPDIVPIHTEETTDSSGVEIRLSVKRENYNDFKNEVQNQLKYFKTKPVVTNGSVVFEEVKDWTINTTNISLKDANYYGAGVTLVQGNVGYPLDSKQLVGKVKQENLNLINMSNVQMVLYFNIGAIGVTPSREAVEYTATTIKSIDDKMDLVRAEITDHVTKELANKATDWDRALALNSSSVLNKFVTNTTIKHANKVMGQIRFDLTDFSKVSNFVFAQYSRYRTSRYSVHPHITPEVGAKFVLMDTTVRMKERMKIFFAQNQNMSRFYAIERSSFDQAFIDELKEHLGGYDNIVKFSDTIIPKRVGVSRKGVKVSTFYKGHPNTSSFADSTNSWTKEHESFDDIDITKIYVTIGANSRSFDWDVQALLRKYAVISRLEQVPDIICVRLTNLKKIEKNPLFVKLEDFIAKKVVEYNTEENKKQIRNSMVYHTLNSKYSYDYNDQFKVMKEHCKDHKLTRVLSIALEKHTQYPRHANLQAIAGLINFTPTSVSKVVERFDKVFKLVKSNYALFSKWTKYDTIPAQHFVEYLNAVDAARKAKVKV
jgi:uncharacterized protein YqgQ